VLSQRSLCVWGKAIKSSRHTPTIRQSQKEGSVQFDAVPSMPPQETSSTQHTESLSDGVQIQTLTVRRVGRQNCFDMHFIMGTSVIAYIYLHETTPTTWMRVGVMVKHNHSKQGTADKFRWPARTFNCQAQTAKLTLTTLLRSNSKVRIKPRPSEISPHSPPRSSSPQPHKLPQTTLPCKVTERASAKYSIYKGREEDDHMSHNPTRGIIVKKHSLATNKHHRHLQTLATPDTEALQPQCPHHRRRARRQKAPRPPRRPRPEVWTTGDDRLDHRHVVDDARRRRRWW
jgi:hypothetical protein